MMNESKEESLIFIFVDGIGLGDELHSNPFYMQPMSSLHDIAPVKLLKNIQYYDENITFKGIDSCLGIPGVPQSATGQTSLFTGVNVSKLLGHHLTAYPNNTLINIIHKSSILKDIIKKGYKATFANAYTNKYFELRKEGKITHSVTTHCVLAAKSNFWLEDTLLEGKAVYWDMTNEHLQNNDCDRNIPVIKAETAGKNLLKLSDLYNLVLYECFLPDLIGHKKNMTKAIEFIINFNMFVDGILKGMNSHTTLLITSDHGNIEDLSTSAHTCNKVPLLVIGKRATLFKEAETITDIYPIINSIFY